MTKDITDETIEPHIEGILRMAINKTPGWVFAFSGGMLSFSLCLVVVLQFSGLASPLQRVINAKASGIERAAESLSNSAAVLNGVSVRLEAIQGDLDNLKRRMETVEKVHERQGL